MTTSEQAAFQALLDRFAPGSRLREIRPMTGGISARTTALEFTRADGADDRVIVRQHGVADRARNPDIARDEFRLLEIVRAHHVSAPEPIHVDASCEHFPAPVIVIGFVEGEPGVPPGSTGSFIEQAVVQLARIHLIAGPELAFLPRAGEGIGAPPETLDESMQEGRIRAALETSPRMRTNRSTLLHGDYWPGNLLWHQGWLTAVIDWEDAAVGDPLADLGNMRLELLWAAGSRAMERFTERYLDMTDIDVSDLPYWDLRAALRPCGQLGDFGLDPATERRWRDLHRKFVDQAITRL